MLDLPPIDRPQLASQSKRLHPQILPPYREEIPLIFLFAYFSWFQGLLQCRDGWEYAQCRGGNAPNFTWLRLEACGLLAVHNQYESSTKLPAAWPFYQRKKQEQYPLSEKLHSKRLTVLGAIQRYNAHIWSVHLSSKYIFLKVGERGVFENCNECHEVLIVEIEWMGKMVQSKVEIINQLVASGLPMRNNFREGVKNKPVFLGLCPKHRTPPTHHARLRLH